jgi:hypothetical protein
MGISTIQSYQGSKIFEALKGNANLFLMLGGHLVGGVSRTDVVDGHTIYSLRSDYQEESGGNGWLRLMEFQPASDQIQVYTYSPYLDEWKSDSTNYFTFDYDMPGSDCAPFELIQTAPDLKSGSTPEIYWSNRSIDSKYEWKVAVSDGVNTVESPVRSFTAGEGPYTPISVSIDGSSTGVIRRPNSFTASVTPDNVDSQLTYLWSATEQPMVSHQNNLVDSVEFSWNTWKTSGYFIGV